MTLTYIVPWIGILSSHLHIVAMALQRYLAIVFPFRYDIWVTNKRLSVTVAVIWAVSIAFGLTELAFGWDTQLKRDGCGSLSVPKSYTGISQLSIFSSA